MSKTPRTDEREFAAMELKPSSRVVYASLARQLERELADKDRQLTEARAEIERLKGELIRQIQPEEYVLSTYSTTAEPVKNVKDTLIKQMLESLEELVELKDRRHSLPVEIYQSAREKAWEKCRAAIAAAKGEA